MQKVFLFPYMIFISMIKRLALKRLNEPYRMIKRMFVVNFDVSLANTELQKAKQEEKQVSIMKMSFEKQLQSERTLKIQVGGIYYRIPQCGFISCASSKCLQ